MQIDIQMFHSHSDEDITLETEEYESVTISYEGIRYSGVSLVVLPPGHYVGVSYLLRQVQNREQRKMNYIISWRETEGGK